MDAAQSNAQCGAGPAWQGSRERCHSLCEYTRSNLTEKRIAMRRKLSLSVVIVAIICLNLVPDRLKGDAAPEDLITGFRQVEVASVADAIEQLYGKKMYMTHDMRPLATAKFAGPATTVRLIKEEHTEGSKALAGMMDAI